MSENKASNCSEPKDPVEMFRDSVVAGATRMGAQVTGGWNGFRSGAAMALSLGASIFASALYAHILLVVYMNMSGFYGYDLFARPGLAPELMYVQFELLALTLGVMFFGAMPLAIHAWINRARLKEDGKSKSRNLFVVAVALLNAAMGWVWKSKFGASPLIFGTFIVGFLVACFISIVYCFNRGWRWVRLLSCFFFLAGVTVLLPDEFSDFVGNALLRARLGGGTYFEAEFVEPRSVGMQALAEANARAQAISRTSPAPAPSQRFASFLAGGEKAFDCVGSISGKIWLDAPDRLYVTLTADACSASVVPAKGKHPPVTVIDKARLRTYTTYPSSADPR